MIKNVVILIIISCSIALADADKTIFSESDPVDVRNYKSISIPVTGFEVPVDINFDKSDICIVENLFSGYSVYINPRFDSLIDSIHLTDITFNKKYSNRVNPIKYKVFSSNGYINMQVVSFNNYSNLTEGKWNIELFCKNKLFSKTEFLFKTETISITNAQNPGPFDYQNKTYKNGDVIYIYGKSDSINEYVGIYKDITSDMTTEKRIIKCILCRKIGVSKKRYSLHLIVGSDLQNGNYYVVNSKAMEENTIIAKIGFRIK